VAHLFVKGDKGFAVFELHGLLGKIRRQRFIPMSGMTGDSFLTLTEVAMTLLECGFGLLGIHFALRRFVVRLLSADQGCHLLLCQHDALCCH